MHHPQDIPGPGGSVVNSRIFSASNTELWQAWADPARQVLWWGPEGFTNALHEFDLRPGGAWRLTMRSADGTEFHNEKVFIEVIPGEKAVFKHLSPIHVFTMTMQLVPRGGATKLIWRMEFETPTSAELLKFITMANEQNFDRLEAYLGGEI
ncbi:MAG: hypothetical protein RL077_6163 [Verrucomicrobiota bacterium]|jgi:uncharacterized protein YndB with AHSA1/START domain